jgi:hypothetical protein
MAQCQYKWHDLWGQGRNSCDADVLGLRKDTEVPIKSEHLQEFQGT